MAIGCQADVIRRVPLAKLDRAGATFPESCAFPVCGRCGAGSGTHRFDAGRGSIANGFALAVCHFFAKCPGPVPVGAGSGSWMEEHPTRKIRDESHFVEPLVAVGLRSRPRGRRKSTILTPDSASKTKGGIAV